MADFFCFYVCPSLQEGNALFVKAVGVNFRSFTPKSDSGSITYFVKKTDLFLILLKERGCLYST